MGTETFTPKISGLLNNCSLNCGLPVLLQTIELLSQREQESRLPPENDIVYKHYSRIKAIFTQYYGIEQGESFDWTAFNNLLITHTFSANQILFLPIFRNFIAEMGLENGYMAEDLWCLKDIQSNDANSPEAIFWDNGHNPNAGRYNPLDGTEVSRLFYHPLGISTEIYEYNLASNDYVLQGTHPLLSQTQIPWYGELAPLSLYLKDGHYELQPHVNTRGLCTETYLAEINSLPDELSRVHDTLSSSQSIFESNRGLGQLLNYANTFLRDSTKNQAIIDARLTAEEYAAIGARFHNDTPSGRQTFAVILLVIHLDDENEIAMRLLDELENLSINDENGADLLSKAIIDSRGNITVLNQIKRNIVLNDFCTRHHEQQQIVHAPQRSDENNSFQFKCYLAFAAVGDALLGLLMMVINAPATLINNAFLAARSGLFAHRHSQAKTHDEIDLNPNEQRL